MSAASPSPKLRIRWTRAPDGGSVLRCTRPDGSVTWQRQGPRHAPFFVVHDLTHYAVETVLGCRGGFFGLIAQGWEIEDTTGKGPRGALPAETRSVEVVVGMLDVDRAGGALWSAAELVDQLSLALRERGLPELSITHEELDRIRALRGELLRRWGATLPGGFLEVEFGPGGSDPDGAAGGMGIAFAVP